MCSARHNSLPASICPCPSANRPGRWWPPIETSTNHSGRCRSPAMWSRRSAFVHSASRGRRKPRRTDAGLRLGGKRPENLEELAFEPITVLADLLASKKVSATELTEMYLARLERHDPTLVCVVTLTKDLARREAEEADREIRAGLHRLTCEHVWRGRAAIHLRPREPSRLHDAQMDAGQGRAAHSVGDRVRCVRCVGCVRSGVCGT
jgi:hypothetical protein